MSSSKPTNPKDELAVSKLPLHLVPSTLTVYAALSFAEGAAKYGAFNWRTSGVRVSVYVSALERHLAKWKNGEASDAVTKVPHLASVIACAGIILDAALCGTLVDDRPASAPVSDLIDASEEHVRHIFGLFLNRGPIDDQHLSEAELAEARQAALTAQLEGTLFLDSDPGAEQPE